MSNRRLFAWRYKNRNYSSVGRSITFQDRPSLQQDLASFSKDLWVVGQNGRSAPLDFLGTLIQQAIQDDDKRLHNE